MKPIDLMKNAEVIWAKAQVLYAGPSWKGSPDALAIQERILEEPKVYHDLLVKNLDHDNHLVIAYSLKTLEKMGSYYICKLPEKLLNSRNKITVREGSFSIVTDLGGIARNVQKLMKQAKVKAEQPCVGDGEDHAAPNT